MKRGEPRSLLKRIKELAGKRQNAIVTKCHPAIFEIAPLLKECGQAMKQLGPNPPPELAAEVGNRFFEGFEEIRDRHARAGAPFGCPDCGLIVAPAILGDASPGNTSGWHWLADVLHWLRYRIPLRVDLRKREQADWEPTRRVLETEREFEQIRCGRGRSPQKFKGSGDHLQMFIGLWGLGIEALTPEELADFFDRYCPCGSEVHDPEALRKQRGRFQKALAKAPVGFYCLMCGGA